MLELLFFNKSLNVKWKQLDGRLKVLLIMTKESIITILTKYSPGLGNSIFSTKGEQKLEESSRG